MNRSRMRRQRRRNAEKMMELIARGADVTRTALITERCVAVACDLSDEEAGGWFMQVHFSLDHLRGGKP